MRTTILSFLVVLFPSTFAASTSVDVSHPTTGTSHLASTADSKSGKRTRTPSSSPSSSQSVQAQNNFQSYAPTFFPSHVPPKNGGKTGKGSVPSSSSNLCQKRFDLAWEANVNADYTIATTKEEMKERCDFDTTDATSNPFSPNLSCPFIYTVERGFLDSETEVIAFFRNFTLSYQGIGQAFWLFQLYCQCQEGYDLGCTSKIPHGPPSKDVGYDYGTVHVSSYSEFIPASTRAERAEYCAFAGIWNGDFDLDNFYDLPKDVQDCGCFWIGEAQEMVDVCPGVDLGAFFIDPTRATNLAKMVNSVEHVGTSWLQNLTLIMAGKWDKLLERSF